MFKENNKLQFIGIYVLLLVYIFLLAIAQLIIQILSEKDYIKILLALLFGAIYVTIVHFTNSIYFKKSGLLYPSALSFNPHIFKNILIGGGLGFVFLFLPRFILYLSTEQIHYLNFNLSWGIIVFSLLPAVTEELIFRGTFLNFFSKKDRMYSGLLISTLLFGVVHLSNTLVGKQMDFIIMVNLLLGGLCLGLTYLNFGLPASIALHFVWNVLLRGFSLNIDDDLYVNVLIAAICIWLFYLNKRKNRIISPIT